MEKLNELKELLSTPKNVLITTHVRPDADALGSSLALYHYLVIKGHNPVVVAPSGYPNFIKWMDGNDEVVVFDDDTREEVKKRVEAADVVCCLDFSSLSRIEELGEMIRNSDSKKILIDHHLEPESFDDFRLWDNDASSASELVYRFIGLFGDLDLITPSIAECIYAGIMTDTGSFRFPSTSSEVHLIIADLINKGAENAKIHQLVYDNSTESRLRLLGYALSKKLVVLPEFKTAFISFTREELLEFNAQQGDTEGIVNYALSIEGIKFAIFIKGDKEHIKMSFRSVGDFSANQFARDHFSGGGHKNAAGGKSELSVEKTIQKIKGLLSKYKEELTR